MDSVLPVLAVCVVVAGVCTVGWQVAKRRTIVTSDASMRSVDEHFGSATPIACGAALREPAYYAMLYPTAQIRVLPEIVVVNGLGKRGWVFTKSAALDVSAWGPFVRATLAEGRQQVRVYAIGRQLPDALAQGAWVNKRA